MFPELVSRAVSSEETGNPANAFSGMTDKNGWSSTDKGSLQQGCWFPGLGRRVNNSGDPAYVGTYGWYWQAVPSSTSNARNLYVNSNGTANPSNGLNRSFGMPIRPVEEIEEKN